MMHVLPWFASLMTLFAFEGTTKEIHRFTIDGGGVTISTSGTLELAGTIGQPDAGRMSNGELQLTGGFWFSIAPGDCNIDSGINGADYSIFPECKTGPDGAIDPGCQCLDFDSDGDLDLQDFASFGNQFSGD